MRKYVIISYRYVVNEDAQLRKTVTAHAIALKFNSTFCISDKIILLFYAQISSSINKEIAVTKNIHQHN